MAKDIVRIRMLLEGRNEATVALLFSSQVLRSKAVGNDNKAAPALSYRRKIAAPPCNAITELLRGVFVHTAKTVGKDTAKAKAKAKKTAAGRGTFKGR